MDSVILFWQTSLSIDYNSINSNVPKVKILFYYIKKLPKSLMTRSDTREDIKLIIPVFIIMSIK